ncbi:hypothetical protein [Anaeroselena agilis]|uniref:Uncharacterized protein n=1 Tax=Anaeroselena agilis TaxID=3063788 RepID=A0ABU3NUZ0_9FIRM|nr:hypothetical protein [Selenomonadales bacterium 4137-cl]
MDRFIDELDDKTPYIPPLVVSWLEERLSLGILLDEKGPADGLERLGFLKGAQHVLNVLKAAQARATNVL